MPALSRNRRLHRRTFLKGAGTAIALPLLSAMHPLGMRRSLAAEEATSPRRFVAICAGLGFHAPHLFPEQAGRDYTPTPYLKPLQAVREQVTVVSGLSHPNQSGNNGHASSLTWLTSAERPGLAGFRNTVSIDQVIASRLGHQTRFPCLVLTNGNASLSWTAGGVNIPGEQSPAKLFKQLFVDGSADDVKRQMRSLGQGRSILDTVLGDAKSLDRTLGPNDKRKLDEYLTSIRDLETRIGQQEEWTQKPKPQVDYAEPQDVADKRDVVAKQSLMYDMIRLALETDSTRTVTYALGGMNAVPSNIPGVKTDWHNLSHHGKDEAKIEELKLIEEAEFEVFGKFLTDLASKDEDGGSVLDRTTIVFGSNLGNASSHSWRNLPIVVAGGGYRHGSYVAHDEKQNTHLSNLFVSMAQRTGVEIDTFGSSTSQSVDGLG